MRAAGSTDVAMCEGSEWVDLAIESAEKNPAFGDQSWITHTVWTGISRQDNWSVQYLVDSNRRIWGYSFMTALHKKYFDQAMLGRYYEPDVLHEHTLPITPFEGPLYVFIFGVDTHPLLWSEEFSKSTLGAFKLLLKLREFFDAADHADNYKIAQIGATATTENGRRMCEMADMQLVKEFTRSGVIHWVYRKIPDPRI
jgi:hypothetical protein